MPKPYPKEFRDDVVRVARNRERVEVNGVSGSTRRAVVHGGEEPDMAAKLEV